jgi:Tfp pilus assembly protein FimT
VFLDLSTGPLATSSITSPARRRGEHGFSLVDILMVVALIGVVSGIAVPMTNGALAGQKFRNDTEAISHMVGLAKMRASAGSTRARVRANITDQTFLLERWDRTTNAWVVEGAVTPLSQGVTFSFGTVATAPPNTQTTIAFSPVCRAGTTGASAAIGGTACIVFNSRGLPVDGGGATFGGHALYLTNAGAVSATTVTATPRIRRWLLSSPTASQWREEQ